MLKAELHTHIHGDPIDKFIKYSGFDLIDNAKEKGYDVLAFTCHNKFFWNEEVNEYAKSKGIVLIPGIEKDIEGKHTLIYNPPKEVEDVHNFEQLYDLKKKFPEIVIVAAHPHHFDPTCHGNNIIKYFDLFDAWEYNFFWTKGINPNNRTVKKSRKYRKPLIGNSDVHDLKYFGSTYSLIDSEKNVNSILSAIKNGNVTVKSSPLSKRVFFRLVIKVIFGKTKKAIYGQVD
jgi:predicted metal-dependent phosphoesterase TrpH